MDGLEEWLKSDRKVQLMAVCSRWGKSVRTSYTWAPAASCFVVVINTGSIPYFCCSTPGGLQFPDTEMFADSTSWASWLRNPNPPNSKTFEFCALQISTLAIVPSVLYLNKRIQDHPLVRNNGSCLFLHSSLVTKNSFSCFSLSVLKAKLWNQKTWV